MPPLLLRAHLTRASHTLAAQRDEGAYTLLAWGANSHGQLGTGDCHDRLAPVAIGLRLDALPRALTAGGGHTVVIDAGGLCWLAGAGADAGDTAPGDAASRFALVAAGPWALAACGWSRVLLVCEHDRRSVSCLALPSRVLTPVAGLGECAGIASVACGLTHALLVSSCGALFVTGRGRHGQLGLGPETACGEGFEAARRLDHAALRDKRVVAAAAGWQHSLALTEDGCVFGFGSNKASQLGPGLPAAGSDVPVCLNVALALVGPVARVACGWRHSLVQAGDAWLSFGSNRVGQLARPAGADAEPAPIWGADGELVCGSEHTLAHARDTGAVWAAGWGEHGQCGLGGTADVRDGWALVPLAGRAVCLAAGAGHSLALVRK